MVFEWIVVAVSNESVKKKEVTSFKTKYCNYSFVLCSIPLFLKGKCCFFKIIASVHNKQMIVITLFENKWLYRIAVLILQKQIAKYVSIKKTAALVPLKIL